MKWITGNNTFLIQKDMQLIDFIICGVKLGEKEYEMSAQYYEINYVGSVIKKYSEAFPFSIEDELTISNIHLVIEDCLYEFYWSCQYRCRPRQKVNLIMRNLRPYEQSLPFDAEKIISEYEQKQSMNP